MIKLHRLRAAHTVQAAFWAAALWIALLSQAAVAQPPSQAQVGAIRQACRADYQAHCASVPTGGSAALACLQGNTEQLSGACRQAVEAAGGEAPAPRQASAQAAQAPAPDAWPHTITGEGGSVVVYEPQVISWPEQKTLNARTAVAITPTGAKAPILGTIEVSGQTQTDLDDRVVVFSDPKLVATHFPTADTAQATRLDERIRTALANMGPKHVPLDTVLLSLRQSEPDTQSAALNNDPPPIFYSARPASLVVFDGEPVTSAIVDTTLSYVVNTNWDIFVDSADHQWYLLNNGAWLQAAGYKGPWSPAPKLPPAFASIPNDANFAEARKSIPGRTLSAAEVPTIFVSTTPAEIIVTDGPPSFVRIPGTSLQYVSNTGSDLFRDMADQRFYFLVSGRWFAAPGLNGPWSFATPTLPPDFARIPANSPRATVLASVPGTAAAQEAVLQAKIPREATLQRNSAKLEVNYAGPPQFQPIAGTDMRYATNTAFDVIGIGETYYACYQGAWFKAPTPTGPWVLADSVPPAIYTIPPSNPLYHVTYVKVYAAAPTTVTYGYTAGYAMGFITAGVLAYGTGFYYPPVVVAGPVPVYYPYAYSYAGGVAYNSATGAWGRGGAVYGPYGSARAGTAYNPATGAYARGASVYGPYGGAGAFSAYNLSTGSYARGSAAWGTNSGYADANFYNARTGVSGSTNQNANAYSRWGSSVVSGPNATVNTESRSNANGSAGAFHSTTGAEGAGVHGVGGNNASVVKGAGGNTYAGADGNVYRHSSDGWSKYNNGAWNPVQKPTQTPSSASRNQATAPASSRTGNANYGQLEQDRQARFQGSQRQQQFRSAQGGNFRGGGSREGRFFR